MGLVAERYEGDEKLRSKVIGHIMGAIALGVLVGYPLGSILNNAFGQPAPFLVLSVCVFADTGW
jgi:DHA1 family solute carrier family 18 vesicular amine transporter 1/2